MLDYNCFLKKEVRDMNKLNCLALTDKSMNVGLKLRIEKHK